MNKQIPTHPIEPDSASVYLDYGPMIPDIYHQNRIVALIRDPEWVFVYWEISALDPNLKSKISNPSIRWLLRVHNLCSKTHEDTLLSPPDNPDNIQGNWYLKVNPDTEYQLEIGIINKENEYTMLIKSNVVKIPRRYRSENLFHTTYLARILPLVFMLWSIIASCASAPVAQEEKTALPEQKALPPAQTIYADKGPWLGIVGMQNGSANVIPAQAGIQTAQGVQITDIYFNSPAQQAGIRKGDVITEIDGKTIADITGMLTALSGRKTNDSVKITAIRSEEEINLISGTDTTQITYYTIQPGDTLWNIANKFYNDGAKYNLIAEANKDKITAPHKLKAGIEIVIPQSDTIIPSTLDELAKKYQELQEKGNPNDKITFTAAKKDIAKELDVTLAVPPRVLRTLAPPKAEIKDGKNAGWLGVGLEGIKDLAKYGITNTGGAKLTSVSPNSPADKGGLKAGDIIIKYDNSVFTGDESKYQPVLADYIKAKGSGAELALTVLRVIDEAIIDNKDTLPEGENIFDAIKELKVGQQIQASVTKKVLQLDKTIVLGTRMASSAAGTTEPEPNEAIHPELASYTTPIEILTRQIMTATNITDKYEDLIKRYQDDQKWDDGLRIRDMRYLQRDPFKIPRVCDDFIAAINNSLSKSDASFLDVVISKLDERLTGEVIAPVKLKTGKPAGSPANRGISLEEHCKQLEELLQMAEKYRREAFAGLTEDDYNFLQDNIIGFTDRWVRDFHFSEPDEIKSRGETDKRTLQLCSYVNYQKLFAAGKIIASVLATDYLDGLKKDIEAAVQEKEGVLFTKDTPFGKIIISGKGNSKYEASAAIIIDLDGDDFYANNLGGSIKNQPFSIIIDYSGDDRYSSYTNGCQGAGIMGVGMLVDMQGDDIYIAQNWAQGAGLLGVGILADSDGDDSFKGQEFVQGAGLFGIGILINSSVITDDEEEYSGCVNLDNYQANKFAQGFAGPKACGLLIDTDGDDTYFAAGKYPNGYPENVGTFDGWSQGCGTGIRCYADWSMSRSGGIGVLIDGNGSDNYESGTFSQGGGYFFGWGMLYDGGNNDDTYLGTRYAQGFAAHSAIGYFVDEGGDDQYKTIDGVNAGLSWDLTGVVFIDKSGDDTYDAGGFSRGATAHNGFCLFMDLDGEDTYKGGVAGAGGNDYHGGSSLSIFVDAGGDQDNYTGRPNNTIETDKEYSIFIDTNKTLRQLIKDDAYKVMLINKILVPVETK